MRKREIKMKEEIRKNITNKEGRILEVRRSFGNRYIDGKAWWQDNLDTCRNTKGRRGVDISSVYDKFYQLSLKLPALPNMCNNVIYRNKNCMR
jgi:hypothetical protein